MLTEFGNLATTQEQLQYALIVEQRKTNELLAQIRSELLQKKSFKKEVKVDAKQTQEL